MTESTQGLTPQGLLQKKFNAWKQQVDKDYSGVIWKQFRHDPRPYWGAAYSLLADFPEKFHDGNPSYPEMRRLYEENYGKVDWAAHKLEHAERIAEAAEYQSPPGWSWNGQ